MSRTLTRTLAAATLVIAGLVALPVAAADYSGAVRAASSDGPSRSGASQPGNRGSENGPQASIIRPGQLPEPPEVKPAPLVAEVPPPVIRPVRVAARVPAPRPRPPVRVARAAPPAAVAQAQPVAIALVRTADASAVQPAAARRSCSACSAIMLGASY